MSSFKITSPEKSIGLQFWRLHQKWQKKINKALSIYNVTHTQFVILATIQWYQDQQLLPSQSEISKMSGIDKMTLSKAIVKLETIGLIEKNQSKKDTRAINIILTNQSLVLIPKLISAVEKIDKEVFKLENSTKLSAFQEVLITLNK